MFQRCFFIAFCFMCCAFQLKAMPMQEFRAVWVSTVYNIDWPSKPTLSTTQQQNEILKIIQHVKSLGFNAIVLQVRPSSDAIYASYLEPFSRYLTGKQGKAPNPYYDPLEFWITECHKQSIELHAWINPFRIGSAKDPYSRKHIAFQFPNWVRTYNKTLYFDPGIPNVQRWLIQVVADITNRYNLDGIHLDDYFYPYPVNNKPFPDSISFKIYKQTPNADTAMNLADWRRNNINNLIKALHDTIKTQKPWVKFGVSPFGIWRDQTKDSLGSATESGFGNYDNLYADVRTWLKNGWLDYVAPQIYWNIGLKMANYSVLLKWWSNNCFDRDLYIGHALYKINTASQKAWSTPYEIPKQITEMRQNPAAKGSIFFSYHHLLRDLNGLQDSLKNNYYKLPAVTPAMPWLGTEKPQPPSNLTLNNDSIHFTHPTDSTININTPKTFVVYCQTYKKHHKPPPSVTTPNLVYTITSYNSFKILPHNGRRHKQIYASFYVTAINQIGAESLPSEVITVSLPKKVK